MQRLLDKHEEFSEDFTKVINGYKRDNIVLQNSALKNSLEESQLLSAGLKDRVNALMEDNLKLKTTLSEQIFDERLQLLKLSQRKIDSYFAGVEEKEKNSLISLENKVTSSLDALIKDLENVVDVEKSTLLVELIGMLSLIHISEPTRL